MHRRGFLYAYDAKSRVYPTPTIVVHTRRMSSELHIPSFIRRCMPNATEAELAEASETFKRYIAIVIRIHERKERERAVVIRRELEREVQ